MATPNLDNLILKYRRLRGDDLKRDGSLYSLTSMDEGALFANAGSQTNQEIADLATDAANFIINTLADIAAAKKTKSFPAYEELSRFIPEYLKKKTTAFLYSNSPVPSIFEYTTNFSDTDYFGYLVGAVVSTSAAKYKARITDQEFAQEVRSTTGFDELQEEPLVYFSSPSSGALISVVVDWVTPPSSSLQGVIDITYIMRQPPASRDLNIDIYMNPKFNDRMVDLMLQRNDTLKKVAQ